MDIQNCHVIQYPQYCQISVDLILKTIYEMNQRYKCQKGVNLFNVDISISSIPSPIFPSSNWYKYNGWSNDEHTALRHDVAGFSGFLNRLKHKRAEMEGSASVRERCSLASPGQIKTCWHHYLNLNRWRWASLGTTPHRYRDVTLELRLKCGIRYFGENYSGRTWFWHVVLVIY